MRDYNQSHCYSAYALLFALSPSDCAFDGAPPDLCPRGWPPRLVVGRPSTARRQWRCSGHAGTKARVGRGFAPEKFDLGRDQEARGAIEAAWTRLQISRGVPGPPPAGAGGCTDAPRHSVHEKPYGLELNRKRGAGHETEHHGRKQP